MTKVSLLLQCRGRVGEASIKGEKNVIEVLIGNTDFRNDGKIAEVVPSSAATVRMRLSDG